MIQQQTAHSRIIKDIGEFNPLLFSGEEELTPSDEPEASTPPKPYYNKFLESIIDQRRNYPDPKPILTINQGDRAIPLLTLESLGLIKGKQKSKKTTALMLFVAAMITPERPTGFIQRMTTGVIIYFDTEQGNSYGARSLRMALNLAKIQQSENLIYCNLRQYSPSERREIIKAAIENTQELIWVIIDGAGDLAEDKSQPRECHEIVASLLRLCSEFNIHISAIIHQNKADKNAQGHMGTALAQKCEAEISIDTDDKDKNLSIISCEHSRGMRFEPFGIRWENDSLPVFETIELRPSTYKNQESNKSKKEKDMQSFIENNLEPGRTYRHADLLRLMQSTGMNLSKAKHTITSLRSSGLLVVNSDKSYEVGSCSAGSEL